jgi:5'-3' exoribonuclease 2
MYRFRQGWVTDSGFVNLERVQMIMNELGRVEDQIFKKRQQDELHFRYISIVPFAL